MADIKFFDNTHPAANEAIFWLLRQHPRVHNAQKEERVEVGRTLTIISQEVRIFFFGLVLKQREQTIAVAFRVILFKTLPNSPLFLRCNSFSYFV